MSTWARHESQKGKIYVKRRYLYTSGVERGKIFGDGLMGEKIDSWN
jgi:hypothetical protein